MPADVEVFGDLGKACAEWAPQYIVLAAETAAHYPLLEGLSKLGFAGTVLVEKPLFETRRPLPINNFRHCYVAYQLRFHPVIRKVRDLLGDRPIDAISAYVSQHLADWRPGRDWRATYSAQADGGGVIRDLSHELDYIMWMAGPWERVTALIGGRGDLAIDAPADAALLFTTQRCPAVSVRLGYLDRPASRWLLAQSSGRTIAADLIASTVTVNGVAEFLPSDKDLPIREMHRAALTEDSGGQLCSADDGMNVCALIDAAARAACDQRWVVA